MPWNPGLIQLRDLLAELYPTEQLSRQFLAQASLPTGRIPFSASATTNWHSLLAEAVRRDQALDEYQRTLPTGAPSAPYTPHPPPDAGTLPDPGPLPRGYRLPFDRNALFTGREP